MSYLAEQNKIHADLAARNILVTGNPDGGSAYLAKIGDLGLSKGLHSSAAYYSSKGTAFAVKWSSPVCFVGMN